MATGDHGGSSGGVGEMAQRIQRHEQNQSRGDVFDNELLIFLTTCRRITNGFFFFIDCHGDGVSEMVEAQGPSEEE